jgi:hypothetical protein
MRGAARAIAYSMVQNRNKEERDNRYIRGSSIGMCKKRIGYQILGYQGVPEGGHSLFILDLGNAIHDMVQRYLVKMGWIKAKPILQKDGMIDWKQLDDPQSGCELSIINHDLRIIGHCDGVTVPLVKNPNAEGLDSYYPDPSGERYLIEIKSITDKPRFWVLAIRDGGTDTIDEEDCPAEFINISYETSQAGNLMQKISRFQHSRTVRSRFGTRVSPVYKLKVEGRDELVTVLMVGNSMGAFSSLERPKSEHVMQASLYAHELNLNKIIFIYVGKDIDSRTYEDAEDLLNLPVKVYEHTVQPLDIATIKGKIRNIYEYVDKGELPPRDYGWDEDKSSCKWCPYAWQCWPDKVNIDRIRKQLEALGLPELKEGPSIMHKPKRSLEKDYAEGKKVV